MEHHSEITEMTEAFGEEVLSQNNTSNLSIEDESEEASSPSESLLSIKQEPQLKTKSIKPENQTKLRSRSKIIFNVTDAAYTIVKDVGKKIFKWRLSSDPSHDWDICWTDKSVPIETLSKMRPYQKINHFPGIQSIARKNNLGRNLMKMYKMYPENYSFFPTTYLLPLDMHDFKAQFSKTAKADKTFIVKPEASCQGRGIFLTRNWEEINQKEKFVAQKYIKNPYLIDGLKFDLRIYVLLAGCDPLRVYLYEDGLGRFATEPYCQPTEENLASTCMHLTNYAINKENPNFVFNNSSAADDVGHKKSLKAVFKILEEQGHDTKALWEEIKKIIIKVFCSVQPLLAHYYRSCHANEPYNNMCFEVLGFDVMLDSNLKPWLIEVNHLPSFATDTPLDENIKGNVIRDALKIMNISEKDKINYKNKKKEDFQQKAMSRKAKFNAEERRAMVEKAQQERDEWESKNHGGYQKIFPLDDENEADEDYYEFMRAAGQHWQTWIGADVKKDSSKAAAAAAAKQEANNNQENQTNETEPQVRRKNSKSPPRNKLSVSPKQSSRLQPKRTPSSKALKTLKTESIKSSKDLKEGTEGRHREYGKYKKSGHLAKSSLVFPRGEDQMDDDSETESSASRRERIGSERMTGKQKESKTKTHSPYGLAVPKKGSLKIESNIVSKESSMSITRALSPSENIGKGPVKRPATSNRRPVMESSSPVKRFNNLENEEGLEFSTKGLRRLMSPKREHVKESKVLKMSKLRNHERSVSEGQEGTRKAGNSKEREEVQVVEKSLQKVKKKKKTQKVKDNMEVSDKAPKTIMLHLSRETLTTLEQENKRIWPAAISPLKSREIKGNGREQMAVSAMLPQYYKVKLGRDLSPLRTLEEKLGYGQKEKVKRKAVSKKESILGDSEMSHSRLMGIMKDMSMDNTPKGAHLSPKPRKVQSNNFFK